MYDVTSIPLVSRTRATFRSAEFGFFGVVVYTRRQTPRFCGQACMAGVLDFFRTASRPLRTSWLMVGIYPRRQEQRQNPNFITFVPCRVNAAYPLQPPTVPATAPQQSLPCSRGEAWEGAVEAPSQVHPAASMGESSLPFSSMIAVGASGSTGRTSSPPWLITS